MNGGTLPDGAQLLLDISHWMAVAAPYMALVIAAGLIAACGISWRRALLVRDALAGRVRVETVPTSTFDPGESCSTSSGPASRPG
ncbi:hypothetical protein ACWCQJ_31545 [Streptomyces olivaceus]|uniref:hypothetical protein n=1 Tax=Streptomyces olivaceus TaxID=47716 RepID=UPI001CCD18B3|nr:hypothetical protein [Streptomyces olivaceus]